MLESERRTQELRTVLKCKSLGVRDQIAGALKALGHKVKTSDGESVWDQAQITEIDGTWFRVIVKPTEASSGYRFTPTGKLCVSVGRFGGMKTYPEPKAGFDVAKLAGLISAAVKGMVMADKARELAAARYKKNQVEVESLRRAFDHVGGLDIMVEHDRFKVRVAFPTAEAARRWLAGIFPKELL